MIIRGDLRGWTDDAVAAMQANPPYFAWWYTVKSIALVFALGGLAYMIGRSSPSRTGRRMNGFRGKSPAEMTAGQINKELDRLDAENSKITDEMIEAGRGNETASETWTKTDPLAMRWRRVADRRMDLRNEISQRYGPGAPSRLPKGFKPRR